MTPGELGLMTAIAVATIGAAANIRAATISRRAQRDAAQGSPYEALAARMVQAEQRIDTLETELRTERERSAHQAAAFRTRIQVLLRYIASLDEYAEVLVNIIREKRIELVSMPKKPELPTDAADEL